MRTAGYLESEWRVSIREDDVLSRQLINVYTGSDGFILGTEPNRNRPFEDIIENGDQRQQCRSSVELLQPEHIVAEHGGTLHVNFVQETRLLHLQPDQ